MLLIVFAFFAGIVTILSPCILPILPIVLSGALGTSSKARPLGIVIGFVSSFTFFTLFLSVLVKSTGLSADVLRTTSVIIIILFGFSLLVPKVQQFLELLFARLSRFAPQQNTTPSFWGGILLGFGLGLVWTPCVGPIIASVITLAATSQVNALTFFITLAYSIGTAIPMLVIIYTGGQILQKNPWLLQNSAKIQKAFGFIMIVVAISIYFNYDRKFQSFVLEKFPNYGIGLTQFENNNKIKNELNQLKAPQAPQSLPKGNQLSDLFDKTAPTAPELIPGGEWFNTKPLTLKGLRGNVVLVDFWTYTCINCIRTLPYLKSWEQKYKNRGLVIIGVHTPEFEFEKNAKNVEQAIKDFKIEYPVMQDNNYDTWNAYNNHYWPAKYFIDKNGKIRDTHFGEGNYDESEKIIQKLLEETGSDVGNISIDNPSYNINARTPETYLGYSRIQSLFSPENIKKEQKQTYSIPKSLPKNRFAYSGNWLLQKERAIPDKTSSLKLNFEAGNVFLVMRSNKKEGKVKVLLDDKAVEMINAGDDVKDGIVIVGKDKLYSLIKLKNPGSHVLTLEFEDDGIELYAFTFG